MRYTRKDMLRHGRAKFLCVINIKGDMENCMHVSRDSTKGPALIGSKDKQCSLAKEEDKQCRRQALRSATQKCIRGLACAVQLGAVHANQAAPVTVRAPLTFCLHMCCVCTEMCSP